MTVGVLALQGAFEEHIAFLRRLGVEVFEIRKRGDLRRAFDGLILPGGESTVISSLLRELKIMESLREAVKNGLPVLGTCAGLILLAKEIAASEERYLGTMDINVVRNGYGRQLGSFAKKGLFLGKKIEMRFIRAPYIKEVGKNVRVLAVVDHKIVAAQEGNQLVTAFHPELTGDDTVHRHFLEIIHEHTAMDFKK
ncbi:MAG TPA: pyridoxal 5'-phosphate synthase glutaminase subunit PdxT [Clostridiales bacterium]|nr:pyridoxal 5'-phosphate synthase glutaminase subunit PdxT [Clostridiales bacterium]